MPLYKGPVRPGRSEKTYRETGKSVRKIRGPVRPSDDEGTFRRTGRSTGGGGGSSRRGKSKPSPTYKSELLGQTFKSKKARAKAEKEFKQEQKRKREQRQREQEAKEQRIQSGKISGQFSSARQDENPFEQARRRASMTEEERAAEIKRDIRRRFESVGGSSGGGLAGSAFGGVQERDQRNIKQTRTDLGQDVPESINLQQQRQKKPISTVTPVQPSGLFSRAQQFITRKTAEKETAKIRGKNSGLSSNLFGGAVGGFTSTVVGGLQGFAAAPGLVKQFATKPKQTTKRVGESLSLQLKQSPRNIKSTLRNNPGRLIGQVGGEVALFKGSAFAGRQVGRLGSKVSTRLNPKFTKIKGGKIDLSGGRSIRLTERVTEDIAEQTARAGRGASPVSTSSGFFKRFSGSRVVRKPIKNINKLTPETKNLLKRFDVGDLKDVDDIKRLNVRIKAETGSKGLLERSFFADPKGRTRPSRLGTGQKPAKIVDVLSGDVSLKKARPQVLTFGKETVEDFPKNLRGVVRKVRAGQKLTPEEEARLIQFQTTPSGKFKPLGFSTRESEITLAPGETIIKKGKEAVTEVGGSRVDIFKAGIKRASPDDIIKGTKKGADLLDDAKSFGGRGSRISSSASSSSKASIPPYLSPSGLGSGTAATGLSTISSSIRKTTSKKPSSAVSNYPFSSGSRGSSGISGGSYGRSIILGSSGVSGSRSSPGGSSTFSSPGSPGRGTSFGSPGLTPSKPTKSAKKKSQKPRKAKIKRKSKIFLQPTQYQPSFTGSIFKFKGAPTRLSKSAGYNPFQVRGLVNGKKKKVSKRRAQKN